VAESENSGPGQPKGVKRSDPTPRPVEGAINRAAVAGQDPDKHYVYVSTVNDPTMSTATYRSMGYRFSEYEPDGEQPVYGAHDLKPGDKIESFGMVLMECSKEHKANLDQNGSPGCGLGQKWADKIVDTIKRRDIGDETEPLSAADRARMRGITTGKRYAGDTREQWEF
jgi:hypothetical protein